MMKRQNTKVYEPKVIGFLPPRYDWRCEMYGMGPNGVVVRPSNDQVPNWFWRKMQWLFLGHKWIKKDNLNG